MSLKDSMNLLQVVIGWIQTDVERCLALDPGPNFLVALVLSEYTEIMGGFVSGELCNPTKCRSNYQAFLQFMGSYYVNLDSQIDMYKNVRCGLSHQYFVKGPSTIAWRKSSPSQKGLYLSGDRVVLNCEAYYDNWKSGTQSYVNSLATDQLLQKNLKRSIRGLVSTVASRPIFRIP